MAFNTKSLLWFWQFKRKMSLNLYALVMAKNSYHHLLMMSQGGYFRCFAILEKLTVSKKS